MAALDRQGLPKSLLERENERKSEFITAIGTLQAFSLISIEKVMHQMLEDLAVTPFWKTVPLLAFTVTDQSTGESHNIWNASLGSSCNAALA